MKSENTVIERHEAQFWRPMVIFQHSAKITVCLDKKLPKKHKDLKMNKNANWLRITSEKQQVSSGCLSFSTV